MTARPFVVGLTGGIASGKSAVAGLLAEHGAVIVDSDRLAREVVEPGTDGARRRRSAVRPWRPRSGRLP